MSVDLFIPEDAKKIGGWFSGGADSTLLLFLLTKKIREEKLPVTILPMSVRRGRPWNPVYAAAVIDWITDYFNAEDIIEHHRVYYPPLEDSHQCEHQEFVDRVIELVGSDKEIHYMYSGITQNPDQEIQKTFRDGVNKEEGIRGKDAERRKVQGPFLNPFFDVDKRWVAEQYEKHGLMDTLFPLTRSCEGFERDTGNYTRHCGKCWWCEERKWAFGRLV